MERTHNLKVYLWCSFFLFVVGETLHFKDTSNGYINVRGSKAFKFFLNCCDLLEYPFHGHRYTWFRGSLMSRIDRDFATPDCFLHFPDLSFSRYPRGLSDHCHLVIGSAIQKWGWRPFRFLWLLGFSSLVYEVSRFFLGRMWMHLSWHFPVDQKIELLDKTISDLKQNSFW
jgi:hypothetical protein